MPTYIDMTPTWEAVLPIYIAAIQHGDYDGKKAALEELTRMAKLADLYIASAKSVHGENGGEGSVGGSAT